MVANALISQNISETKKKKKKNVIDGLCCLVLNMKSLE